MYTARFHRIHRDTNRFYRFLNILSIRLRKLNSKPVIMLTGKKILILWVVPTHRSLTLSYWLCCYRHLCNLQRQCKSVHSNGYSQVTHTKNSADWQLLFLSPWKPVRWLISCIIILLVKSANVSPASGHLLKNWISIIFFIFLYFFCKIYFKGTFLQ